MSTAPTPRPVTQDPLKVDPKHYKVEFENDRVRVLRITYGPREKSVMHGHPATVAVFSTENRARSAVGQRARLCSSPQKNICPRI